MKWIKHYGIPRRSGRYPWGSGKDPEQRNTSLSGYAKNLRKKGLSEVEIAEGLGLTTSELRSKKAREKAEKREAAVTLATTLHDKGWSNVAIGKRMGLNESSVRALLNKDLQARSNATAAAAKMLKDVIDKHGPVDVGVGVETYIGISRTKLNNAVDMLKDEGYKLHTIYAKQQGTDKFTIVKVLAPESADYKDIFKNRANIASISDFAQGAERGTTLVPKPPIKNISSKRVMIRYGEEGGKAKDGVIELRRGVEDLSLGDKKYAQVRIGVDGTHFLKGMAIYSDNMPKGIDVIYNSNKPKGTDPTKVFKEQKSDPDNPFGSSIKEGGRRGALNIVNEEGDWANWSKNISSQVLSKQSPALAKKQLDLAKNIKVEELDEIAGLTNPVVKKRLLESFADDADAAAVNLKAAALPRQASHIILPIPSMKENEIYAPNYRDGETVVLIRHPHGGTFEIPELKVNNRNAAAQSVMKNAQDAVGIHPKVAEKLSGADFDGDSVLVIPNKNKDIRTSASLAALKDFDTKLAYPPKDGMRTIDGGIYNAKTEKVDYGGKKPNTAPKQMQMGIVSNLITDMTIKGATAQEIARAVKHSMVVIDAEKHHLDYKQSALDNNIAELKEKYQGSARAGASTLISRASSEIRVPNRKESFKVNPKTGEKVYTKTGATFVNRKGKETLKTTLSTKMAETKNAFDLSSGTKIETIYAEHANALKALANKARLLASQTPNLVYSPTAKKTYAPQVESLRSKLNIAYRNKPLERKAQLLAASIVQAKRQANPDMEADDLKRLRGQALEEARTRTGAKKQKIQITDKEWEAIQMGAVSNNVLTQIVQNTDLDALKVRSTPRSVKLMTPAKKLRAKSMAAAGYTQAEIADALGVSTTTLKEAIQ